MYYNLELANIISGLHIKSNMVYKHSPWKPLQPQDITTMSIQFRFDMKFLVGGGKRQCQTDKSALYSERHNVQQYFWLCSTFH